MLDIENAPSQKRKPHWWVEGCKCTACTVDKPHKPDCICSDCLERTFNDAAFRHRVAAEYAPAEDPVNHPAHYTAGGIECIEAIRAALTPEEFRGFCKGNAIKYVWRERHKGGDESLAKAAWYMNALQGGK